MKFTIPKRPFHGKTRQRKWFAIFPVRIGRHIRWMETVHVKQVYQGIGTLWNAGWRNDMFLN